MAFVLFALRFVVLSLVLGLVCLQPIYARDVRRDLPGKVLIAIDRSASMSITDPQRPGAEKLRLAAALGLHKGKVSEELLARWIADHDQKRDPQMVLPSEASNDAAVRLNVQQQRQQAHDQLIASVDALTRSELARIVLAEDGFKLLSRIQERHDIEIVAFHRETWEMSAEQLPELSARLEPKEMTSKTAGFTDLRLPLSRAIERTGAGQGKVIAVVLFSDGQHNLGAPPAASARELGERQVPIYPIALGARQGPPDAAIVSVRGPDYTVFKDVEAVFDVRFKISGLPAQDFVVELLREGKDRKPLLSRTVHHEGQDRLYTESFPVKMAEPGTQTITARIRPVQPGVEELTGENNQLSTTVSVADDRAKVLVIDGEARWEYHYLTTALARDRLVDLNTIVFEQPRLDERLSDRQREKMGLPARKWPTETDALANYQCIVLGDVNPEHLPLAKRQELEKYVAESAGTLIVIAGKRYLPLAYPEATPTGDLDPLRRLLPIEGPRPLAPTAGFPLSLTQSGRETRFMELDAERADNDELWAGQPRPWLWGIAGKTKPAATALASYLDPAEAALSPSEREKQHTVFARHNYGFGRVLYIGVDNTWRWRYKVGDLYHHRFWGQVIRWAAADRPLVVGNSFVRFGTPQPVFRPGEAVEVVARLSETLGQLRSDLLAGARILRLGEDKAEQPVAMMSLERRPGQPRVLEGKLRDLPPGRYGLELAIPELADKLLAPAKDGEPARPLRATFSILPPESREMLDLELNLPLLDDLARASGGKVFTSIEIDELEKLLVKQGIPHVEHHEQKVWQWWVMLVVVVVMLTMEWGLRKAAGLP
jgi:hypothetical protein